MIWGSTRKKFKTKVEVQSDMCSRREGDGDAVRADT